MPLLAAELMPTSHRVCGIALGLGTSRISSILFYYRVLFWEEENVVLPYMALSLCALVALLITVAAPDPPSSLHVPLGDAKRWLSTHNYSANAQWRLSRLYTTYFCQFTGMHARALACAVGGASVGGFAVSKVLAFMMPGIRRDLHVPRTSMSLMYSLAVVVGAVLQPGIGALVDEHGYRLAFAVLLPIMGLGFLIPLLAEYLRSESVLVTGLPGTLFLMAVTLLMMRGIGTSIQTTSNALVNRWFRQQRGQAMATYHLAFMAVQDLVLVQIVQHVGWKMSTYVAAVSSVLAALFAWLFVIDSPELVGLSPDINPTGAALWLHAPSPGVSPPSRNEAATNHWATDHPPSGGWSLPSSPITKTETGGLQSSQKRKRRLGEKRCFTLSEAMKTPAYYLINTYWVMYAVCGSSVALMLVDIIFDSGKHPFRLDVATYYYGPHFLMATVTTILTGHLIDSGVHEKYLLCAAGVMLSVGLRYYRYVCIHVY